LRRPRGRVQARSPSGKLREHTRANLCPRGRNGLARISLGDPPVELGLPGAPEGLLILREDAKVGQPFAEYLGRSGSDVIYDLEITPNRADLNSVMMGVSSFDDLIKAGKAKFDGDRKPFDQLRGLMVAFTPNFEILPGTAPQESASGLPAFALPDLTPAELSGD